MILCISVESVVTSPFSFLILLSPLPFFFFSDESGDRFINFVYLFKEPAFSFTDACDCFLCLYFVHFYSDLHDFSFLLTLGFTYSSFSNWFRYKVRLFIWDFYYFLRYDFIAINFSLRTAFAASHRFWTIVFLFSFVFRYFFISSSSFDFFSDPLVVW